MKNFKELREATTVKSVVLYLGEANPPTLQHLVTFASVKKIAESLNADYAIIISKNQNENTLSLAQKLEYINTFYPGFNVIGGSDSMQSISDVVEQYSKKYTKIIVAQSSDELNESMQSNTVSYGLHNPDYSATSKKMHKAVNEGDYHAFRKGLLIHARDIDARRMFNDMRESQNLNPIKETIVFNTNDIREQYIAGEIFHEDSFVESESKVYKIINRNSNYVTVSDNNGILSKKWLTSIKPIEASESMQLEFKRITEMKFSSSDKIKVAKIIGGILGADVSKGSNPEQMVNAGLRIAKTKPLNDEAVSILQKMLKTADDAGIAYDQKLVPTKVTSEAIATDAQHKAAMNAIFKDPAAIKTLKNLKKRDEDDAFNAEQNAKYIRKLKGEPTANEGAAVQDTADYRVDIDPVTGKTRKVRTRRMIDTTELVGRTNEIVELDEAQKEYSSTHPYGLRHREFAGRDQRLVTKDTYHKTSAARDKYQEKVENSDNFHEIVGHHDPRTNESIELDEVLTASHNVGDWIADFQDSDAPQFKGKSKEKRREMAIAAHYAAKRNEDVNGLDEELKVGDRVVSHGILGKKNGVIVQVKDDRYKTHYIVKHDDSKFVANFPKEKLVKESLDESDYSYKEHTYANKREWVDEVNREHPDAKLAISDDGTHEARTSNGLVGAFRRHTGVHVITGFGHVLSRKNAYESVDEALHDDSVADHIASIKARTEKAHLNGERYVTLYKQDQSIADAHHQYLNTLSGKHVPLPTGHSLGGSDDQHIRRKVIYQTENSNSPVTGNYDEFESNAPDEDISDEEIDGMISHINDWDDVIDVYDSSELAYIDADSGEHVADVYDEFDGGEGAPEDSFVDEQPVVAHSPKVDKIASRVVAESEELNEVLSRLERIKSKMRFHRTAAKRERALSIALKRHSSVQKLGHRARALAVRTMKLRIAKKPLNQLTVPEKERIEGIIQRRAAVINRIAIRLMPRIRKIEQTRLSHSNYTKT